MPFSTSIYVNIHLWQTEYYIGILARHEFSRVNRVIAKCHQLPFAKDRSLRTKDLRFNNTLQYFQKYFAIIDGHKSSDSVFSSFELINRHDDEKHKKSGQYISKDCPLVSNEKKYIVDINAI